MKTSPATGASACNMYREDSGGPQTGVDVSTHDGKPVRLHCDKGAAHDSPSALKEFVGNVTEVADK